MNRYHIIIESPLFGGPSIRLLLFLLLSLSLSLIVLIPILSGAFFIDHNTSPRREEWSYSKQMEWHHYFPICGEQSKRQSPINIKRENVITNNQLTMKFYNYNRSIKFTIQNAHHTIKMNPVLDRLSDYGASQQFDINTVDEAEPSSYLPLAKDGARLQHNTLERNQGDHTVYPKDDTHHGAQTNLKQDIIIHNNKRSSSNSSTLLSSSDQLDNLKLGGNTINNNNNNNNNNINNNGNNKMANGHDRNNHDTNGIIKSSLTIDATSDHESDNNNINNNVKQQKLPYDGVPMIKLDWMDDHNNEYRLHDIHFHWGTNKDNGSEHLIDGRKSAMEMHLVHIKKGLKKDQIGYNSDSVVVISVLIESFRKSNANLNPIVNTLTSINMSDTSQDLEYHAINDLLPNDRTKFYTYSGSLTTPPCYEVVNWIVMHERVYINAKQMEMFRNIYAKMEHGKEDEHHSSEVVFKIMPNIRHRQSTRGRPIMASFTLNNMINDSENELTSGATTKLAHHSLIMLLALLAVSFYISRLRHSINN